MVPHWCFSSFRKSRLSTQTRSSCPGNQWFLEEPLQSVVVAPFPWSLPWVWSPREARVPRHRTRGHTPRDTHTATYRDHRAVVEPVWAH